MSDITIAEQLIRRSDPTTLQRALIDALDDGVTAFFVKPDGMTWTEFSRDPGRAGLARLLDDPSMM